MNQNPLITLSPKQEKSLLQSTNSKKYKAIILLMIDSGLRVSELVQLQAKNISFSENKIVLTSSKPREIPMTQRLLKSLADYWQLLANSNRETYLFL
ncbi:MAG: tyrosine-type recombinase/integrase [Saprospiraceae bacterium]